MNQIRRLVTRADFQMRVMGQERMGRLTKLQFTWLVL
jgi:hypothetical protein